MGALRVAEECDVVRWPSGEHRAPCFFSGARAGDVLTRVQGAGRQVPAQFGDQFALQLILTAPKIGSEKKALRVIWSVPASAQRVTMSSRSALFSSASSDGARETVTMEAVEISAGCRTGFHI